jgi:hypothetical protein
MSEEVIRLIEQSNLVPPNPHQLVTELLLPAIMLQSVVAVARVFRARGGRDAAFQIVEMNFAAPILAVIGAIFAMLIVTFILFAARAGLSAWIEILTTAKSSTAVSVTEVLANMLYVQHVLVFTLLVCTGLSTSLGLQLQAARSSLRCPASVLPDVFQN